MTRRMTVTCARCGLLLGLPDPPSLFGHVCPGCMRVVYVIRGQVHSHYRPLIDVLTSAEWRRVSRQPKNCQKVIDD